MLNSVSILIQVCERASRVSQLPINKIPRLLDKFPANDFQWYLERPFSIGCWPDTKKILSVSSSSAILLYAISISHPKSGKINQTCAFSFPLASSLHINLFNRTRFSRILYHRLFVSEIAFLKNGQTQIPKLILFRYLRLSSFIMLLHFYQRLPILTFCIW